MIEKKALGRGLGALIPEKPRVERIVTMLKVAEVSASNFQPREDFDPEKLNDLIASIKEKGIIQPILVRQQGDGVYEVVAGERRLRAARTLGLTEIPAIIKDVNDTELLELSLIENIQRENLNPMEEAHAYDRLVREFNLIQEDIAKAVGKDRTTVANTLRLLKLPEFVQNCLQKGEISFGHAKVLLSLENDKEQIEACKRIIQEKMSVRMVEDFVSKHPTAKQSKTVQKDPHLTAVEEDLQRYLGTKVSLAYGKKKGSICIDFYSNDDLERILKLIRQNI